MPHLKWCWRSLRGYGRWIWYMFVRVECWSDGVGGGEMALTPIPRCASGEVEQAGVRQRDGNVQSAALQTGGTCSWDFPLPSVIITCIRKAGVRISLYHMWPSSFWYIDQTHSCCSANSIDGGAFSFISIFWVKEHPWAQSSSDEDGLQYGVGTPSVLLSMVNKDSQINLEMYYNHILVFMNL